MILTDRINQCISGSFQYRELPLIDIVRLWLSYHSWWYYNMDSPCVNDREWDVVHAKLVEMEKEEAEPVSYSPTQNVGTDISELYLKVSSLEVVKGSLQAFLNSITLVQVLGGFGSWSNFINGKK